MKLEIHEIQGDKQTKSQAMLACRNCLGNGDKRSTSATLLKWHTELQELEDIVELGTNATKAK